MKDNCATKTVSAINPALKHAAHLPGILLAGDGQLRHQPHHLLPDERKVGPAKALLHTPGSGTTSRPSPAPSCGSCRASTAPPSWPGPGAPVTRCTTGALRRHRRRHRRRVWSWQGSAPQRYSGGRPLPPWPRRRKMLKPPPQTSTT